jgi:hypothetical protein
MLEMLKSRAREAKIENIIPVLGTETDPRLPENRYMVLDRITPAAYDYAFYPSDLYYADVAKADGSFEDWNARKDGFHAGYFGEVRGEKNKNDPINFDQVDYMPELAVGRWPVSSSEQLRTIIAKTIAFEKGLAKAQEHPRAAFVAASGWVDARDNMNRMASSMPQGWRIEKRYDGSDRDKEPIPPATEKEVLGLLNSGVDLVVHAGHGTDTSWERCLFMDRLSQAHNASRLPVMVSAGCSTARLATLPPYEAYLGIDGVEHKGTNAGESFKEPPPPPSPYQKGRFSPPGLGKQLVVGKPDGTVAGCHEKMTIEQHRACSVDSGASAAKGKLEPHLAVIGIQRYDTQPGYKDDVADACDAGRHRRRIAGTLGSDFPGCSPRIQGEGHDPGFLRVAPNVDDDLVALDDWGTTDPEISFGRLSFDRLFGVEVVVGVSLPQRFARRQVVATQVSHSPVSVHAVLCDDRHDPRAVVIGEHRDISGRKR